MSCALLLLSLLAALGCDRCRDQAPSPGPPEGRAHCRGSARADPERAQRIVELLASTTDGRDLLGRAPESPRICFNEHNPGAVTTEGIFWLDPRASEAESAARLGHLLLHRVEGGVPPPAGDRPRSCPEVVEAAAAAEARAHALELELRRELGVTSPRLTFPFERQFWAAPEPERVGVLRDLFLAHPDGAPGVLGVAAAYRHRCVDAGPARPPGAPDDAGIESR